MDLKVNNGDRVKKGDASVDHSIAGMKILEVRCNRYEIARNRKTNKRIYNHTVNTDKVKEKETKNRKHVGRLIYTYHIVYQNKNNIRVLSIHWSSCHMA